MALHYSLKKCPMECYLSVDLDVAKISKYVTYICSYLNMYLCINIFNRMYNTVHLKAYILYKYYYDVFYLEFSATLGFGLPKTDCCNKCTI